MSQFSSFGKSRQATNIIITKAELLQVGIFFLIHLFAWEILLLKKLEIEKTKTT